MIVYITVKADFHQKRLFQSLKKAFYLPSSQKIPKTKTNKTPQNTIICWDAWGAKVKEQSLQLVFAMRYTIYFLSLKNVYLTSLRCL